MTAPTSVPVRVGIIGGSGLGEAVVETMNPVGVRTVEPTTPFGPAAAPIVLGVVDDAPVAILKRHGEGHRFGPSAVPFRANVWAMKAVGCTHVIASGACGSLRDEIRPGDLVLCDQLIDRTDGRHRSFFGSAAVHVEFADPTCPVMAAWLRAACGAPAAPTLHPRGAYVCIEGPAFSTRAESALHRHWGADVVGMTALPEARLVREAQMAYALLALPTDFDCWRPRGPVDESSLLEEIRANLGRAVDSCLALVRAALRDATTLRQHPSPAHSALARAVWTSLDVMDATDADRVRWLRGG